MATYIYNGSLDVLDFRKAAPRVFASIGSPNAVPVPCASKNLVLFILKPAFSYVSRIKLSCASLLGCVIPGVWPSWLDPVDRMTARIVSPSRRASVNRFKTRTPNPSPLA